MSKPTRPAARRKPSKPPAGSRPPRRPRRLVAIQVRLEPAQVAALRQEAARRSGEPGGRPTEVDEVLREAASVWMSIRPGQRAIIRAVATRRELTRPEVLREALDAWLTTLDPKR